MPSLNFKIRILQVTCLIVVALLVVKLTQWEQGLWVAVSITAIVGPFSTSLSLEKSRNRIIGTIAGLLLATILEMFLRYFYQFVPIVGVFLAYCLGFALQQNYRYFIMVVTVVVCLNFEYMNLPFTSFEPLSFLVARFIAVTLGIALFLFIQKYIYGEKNARQELVESTREVVENISRGLARYLNSAEVKRTSALDLAMELTEQSKSFRELLAASAYGMSESSAEFTRARKVDRIRKRLIRLLLDRSYSEMKELEAQATSLSFQQLRLLRIQKYFAACIEI